MVDDSWKILRKWDDDWGYPDDSGNLHTSLQNTIFIEWNGNDWFWQTMGPSQLPGNSDEASRLFTRKVHSSHPETYEHLRTSLKHWLPMSIFGISIAFSIKFLDFHWIWGIFHGIFHVFHGIFHGILRLCCIAVQTSPGRTLDGAGRRGTWGSRDRSPGIEGSVVVRCRWENHEETMRKWENHRKFHRKMWKPWENRRWKWIMNG